jgi:hypothetical protein
MVRLFFPIIARHAAQALAKEHPGLSPGEIRQKMLADVPPDADPQVLKMVDAVVARLPRGREGEAPRSSHLTAALLVAANLVPLHGVLFWGWEVFPLLVLFWAENVIVGVLNVARMLAIDPGDLLGWGAKLFIVPFFCVHYGMFTAGHGVFVFSGMFGGQYRVQGLNPLGAAADAFRDFGLWFPAAILAASHLFSFFWNYLGRGEFRRAELRAQMGKPYTRVILLHVTIILGGMGTMALGSPVWALVLLVALKTLVDVVTHVREHRRA